MTDALRAYTAEECGSDGYPREWHASIKQRVREEAGHRCIRCGHPYPPGIAERSPRGEWTPCDERCAHPGPLRVIDSDGAYHDEEDVAAWQSLGAIIEAQWRILTVHHLDGDKANCRWWNLAALCQVCHLVMQGRVRMERPWPWEHSEWFKRHAAGWYAWHHLGQEITPQETVERIDELLALGAREAAVERMPL